MPIHNQRRFECDEPGCSYRATSAAKLRRHQRSHSDDRPFACDQCDFATKSQPLLQRHMMMHTGSRPHLCPHCPFSSRLSLHLRRHMRVHTGAKPYKCPHCPYQCNVMENLRKHVMSTQRHPGKNLYVCRDCEEFSTNSAKEIQTHLTKIHSSKFSTPSEASAYIMAGIYQAEQPRSDVQESVIDEVQESGMDEVRESGMNEIQEPGIDEVQESGMDAVQESGMDEVQEPAAFSEVSQQPFEDVTHTIDHTETVNIVTAIGRRVIVTGPDGQQISMIVSLEQM